MARQKLLTAEMLKKLPTLYANNGKKPEEQKVMAKFFNPCGDGTWFVLEFDGDDTLYTWYISTLAKSADEGEFGYSSLKELTNLRLKFGLYIERDTSVNPGKYTLAQVMEKKGLV